MQRMIGKWAFIIGVVFAILAGLLGEALGNFQNVITSILVVFGLIVGLLNIQSNETKNFMFGAVVLIIAAWAGEGAIKLEMVGFIGRFLSGIYSSIMAFVVPATIIVALREVYETAKPLK